MPFEARLYDVLFLDENTESAEEAAEDTEDGEEAAAFGGQKLNPDSLKVVRGYAEPWLKEAKVGENFQFMRTAYFSKDKDSTDELEIFNRVVTLKDSFKLD